MPAEHFDMGIDPRFVEPLRIVLTPEDCAYRAGKRAAYYEWQRAKREMLK
jgi:hypothetical protein